LGWDPFVAYAAAPAGADRVVEFAFLHSQVIATTVAVALLDFVDFGTWRETNHHQALSPIND